MLVTRYANSSTTRNLSSLVTLLNDPNCKEVVLYATASTPMQDFSESDGPDNNLPLVAAIAKYVIPGISDVFVLFDGLFLTAARFPRFLEVQDLMNVAQESGKAAFFLGQAPFTSSFEPVDAVKSLLGLGQLTPFSQTNRAKFFALLSRIPEAQYS